MSDINGGYVDHECRPNIIKYPTSKTDRKVKKTKFAPETETQEKQKRNTQKHAGYVPDTNLPLACLVCLCFNFPIGIVAMFLSLSAARLYRDGKVEKGERRAKLSVCLSLISIVTTVLIVMAIVLWIAVADQNERELKEKQT
jgi:hypothetical protein